MKFLFCQKKGFGDYKPIQKLYVKAKEENRRFEKAISLCRWGRYCILLPTMIL
jgi:hypothetical protein